VSVGEKQKLALLHSFFLFLIPAYGVFQLYEWRDIAHSIDSISYLDIGDAWFRGDFKNAINTFWSPMYSWILGLVLFLFKPDMEHELLAMRLTNFGLLLFFTFNFWMFAKTFWDYLQFKTVTWLTKPLYWFYMYSLLTFCALVLGGVDKDTPDMLSASLIVLSSTAFLKIAMDASKTANYVLLGSLLGLGYLSKAIVLPCSAAYYLATWWEARKEKSIWKNLGAMAACEVAFALPWVVAISMTAGHFTISDAPRNFFLWSESQYAQQVHYQLPGLLHTSRKIYSNPDVFEFSTPFDSTYPPWMNAGYWTEGAKDSEPIARKIRYFFNNINFYLLEVFSFLIAGFVVASACIRRPCTSISGIISGLPLVAPALLAMLLYSISSNMTGHMMERYFIAWFALLYSGVLLMARFSDDKRDLGGRALTITISILMLSVFTVLTFFHLHMPVVFPYSHDIVVAKKLQELGLKPGDRIALIPTTRRYFWARLLKLKVVADIADEEQFYKLPPEKREEIIAQLRKYNVKAIVRSWLTDDVNALTQPAKFEPGPDWVKVPPTHARVYLIDR